MPATTLKQSVKYTLVTPAIERDFQYLDFNTDGLANAYNGLKNFFPSFLEKVRFSFASISQIEPLATPDNAERAFLVRNIDSFEFSEVSSMAIQVPEGFDGKYNDYLPTISGIVKEYHSFSSEVLKPLHGLLAVFLSNKDSRLNTASLEPVYTALRDRRQKHGEVLGENFIDSGKTSRKYIRDVFTSRGDIVTVIMQAEDLQQDIAQINLASIKKEADTLLGLISIVEKRIEENTITELSPETANNLALAIYEVGKQIEFLAALHYPCMVIETCIDSVVTLLNKHIRE